jgi:FOG: Ankyrin repeat
MKNNVYFPKFLKKVFFDSKKDNTIIDFFVEISYYNNDRFSTLSTESGLISNIFKEMYDCTKNVKTPDIQKCYEIYNTIRFHRLDFRITEDVYGDDIYGKDALEIYKFFRYDNDEGSDIINQYYDKWTHINNQNIIERETEINSLIDDIYNTILNHEKITKNFNKIEDENIKTEIIKYSKKYIRYIFETTNLSSYDIAFFLLVLQMDFYFFCRCFKKFEKKSTSKIHQDYANKIIVVAGDYHISNYKRFLIDNLNYKLLYSKNIYEIEYVFDHDFIANKKCLDISDLPQPLFMYTNISKYKKPEENSNQFVQSNINLISLPYKINNSKSNNYDIIENNESKNLSIIIDLIKKFHHRIDIIRDFIKKNVSDYDLLNRYTNGINPLIYATGKSYNNVIKLLLDFNVNVNIKANNHFTPLMISCYFDNYEGAKILIENGAFVNVQNAYGYTPLVYSIMNYNKNIIKLLLDNGASVNIMRSSINPVIEQIWKLGPIKKILEMKDFLKLNSKEFSDNLKTHEQFYFPDEYLDINNDKPIDFLVGPMSLYVLYNGEKMFYLFGDYHAYWTDLDCKLTNLKS